jgi:hypothetical protein
MQQHRGGDNEASHHIDVDKNSPRNGVEDINQGNGIENAPKIKPTYQPPQPHLRQGRNDKIKS